MKHIINISLVTFLLSGCSFVPDYQRPQLDTPSAWSEGANKDAAPEIKADWWTNFGSAELDRLMEQALAHNNDLLAGEQTIAQARAALKIAGADLFPSLDGSAGASRSRTNPATGDTAYSTSLQLGSSVSYELDLFGKNRAGQSKARAGFEGSVYDQEALKLVVMSEVAQDYFTLVNLRERLGIADNNLANAREVLRIIDSRVREGAESELQLAQQKSAVASDEAARARLVQQVSNAENALAVLLGQVPQTLEIKVKGIDGWSVPDIAPGQPSSLLERRPDLRSVEAALEGANADIGAARAAFYPSISLGLSGSVSQAGFGAPGASALSALSSLAAPIFSGGALEGGVEKADAHQLALVETYRKTVLVSFQEVEDALAAVKAADAREKALKTAMEQARVAYRLSKQKYDAGSIDFQTLLDTQTVQLTAEDSYAQGRLARLLAAVSLYKALGGGWSAGK